MCFHSKQSKKAQALEKRFKAKIVQLECFAPKLYNGFDHPKTPVITNEDTTKIQMIHWGLLPHWATQDFNKNHTLNARVEQLKDKPSFKNIIDNRCVILVDGFYEWKKAGTQKIKYDIGFNGELFALAGLYDVNNGYKSYTVVTTEAQGIMITIHNTKFRMPFALKTDEDIYRWLHGQDVNPSFDFTAKPLGPVQGSLF